MIARRPVACAIVVLLAAVACAGLVRGARVDRPAGAITLGLALAALFAVIGTTYRPAMPGPSTSVRWPPLRAQASRPTGR